MQRTVAAVDADGNHIENLANLLHIAVVDERCIGEQVDVMPLFLDITGYGQAVGIEKRFATGKREFHGS